MSPVSLDAQRAFWNEWNAKHRERADQISPRSRRQADVITGWLNELGRRNLDILEVGCASGWFAEELTAYGSVAAQDLADELIARAKVRAPHIQWHAGDVMALPLAPGSFDVIIHLELLSHVADQQAFIARMAELLRPSGHMMMATQNQIIHARLGHPPAAPGQIRNWVSGPKLYRLTRKYLRTQRLTSIIVEGDGGFLRWVNAKKINRAAATLLRTPERVARVKERMWLGHTLMYWGTKP